MNAQRSSRLHGTPSRKEAWAWYVLLVAATLAVPIITARANSGDFEAGNVVVFKHPTQNAVYVSRLIGIPGDTIQLKQGLVHLNGNPVLQSENGIFEEVLTGQGSVGNSPQCANDAAHADEICMKEQFIETLSNGSAYSILNFRASLLDNAPEFALPEGRYFVMGDNRGNSLDSRMPPKNGGVGFVPEGHIISHANRVIFSSVGSSLAFFWTWRSDRYLKAIQ